MNVLKVDLNDKVFTTLTSDNVIFTYNNGDQYTGSFKNGMRHGDGFEEKCFKHNDTNFYVMRKGTWEHNKLNGAWVEEYFKHNDDGSKEFAGKFEGGYVDDRRTGWGRYDHFDNEYCEGFWSEECQGIYHWSNGITYKGNFEDDYQSRLGKMTLLNGDVYEGGWKEDNKHGKRKLTKPDGTLYEKDFNHNLITGNGKCTYPEAYYEGQLVDGNRHGFGEYIWNDGRTYKGYFDNGECHGYGVATFPEGDVFDGEFIKDKFYDDDGVCLYNDGIKIMNDFKVISNKNWTKQEKSKSIGIFTRTRSRK
jgi:hypothetical protein